jgi:hypothetical protein
MMMDSFGWNDRPLRTWKDALEINQEATDRSWTVIHFLKCIGAR